MPVEPQLPPSRRLQLAYLSVLGDPDKRGPDQRLVMADIESHCYAHRLVSEGRTDGEVAIYRSLFNDGRRSVWLRIRGQIMLALAEPRKAPTVSRKKPVS